MTGLAQHGQGARRAPEAPRRERAARRGRLRALVPTLATAALLPVLIGLGLWQLDRAGQKEALERDFAERAEASAVALPASAPPAALRYRPVRASGRWDGERQFLLDNRTHDGRAGYHVLSPLRLAGRRSAVLVNRGWQPLGSSRAALPALPLPAGAVTVRGIADLPREDTFLLGAAGYAGEGWPLVVQRAELDAMAARLGYPLLPVMVLLDPEAPHGFVRDWRPVVGIGSDRHRAYAFQWFALAAALAVIWAVVPLRRSAARG